MTTNGFTMTSGTKMYEMFVLANSTTAANTYSVSFDDHQEEHIEVDDAHALCLTVHDDDGSSNLLVNVSVRFYEE